jgi:hypothetical protein
MRGGCVAARGDAAGVAGEAGGQGKRKKTRGSSRSGVLDVRHKTDNDVDDGFGTGNDW